MLLALLTSLSAQAMEPVAVQAPPTAFVAPSLVGDFALAEPELRYDAMPSVGQQDVYGEAGWFVTGLLLAGGGAVVMGVSAVGMNATDNRAVDQIFSWTGLFGALHFVVGASMIGLEFTEGRSARVVFTGNGLAGTF